MKCPRGRQQHQEEGGDREVVVLILVGGGSDGWPVDPGLRFRQPCSSPVPVHPNSAHCSSSSRAWQSPGPAPALQRAGSTPSTASAYSHVVISRTARTDQPPRYAGSRTCWREDALG